MMKNSESHTNKLFIYCLNIYLKNHFAVCEKSKIISTNIYEK